MGVLGPGAHKVLFEPSKCLWWVCGLILNVISPLLPLCWGFSLALGHGVSFFGCIQHSPVNGCSAVCCNFGVLAGEDECTSFYHAMLCVPSILIDSLFIYYLFIYFWTVYLLYIVFGCVYISRSWPRVWDEYNFHNLK